MIKVRNLGAILALSGLAALPACSMFGGGGNHREASSSYSSPSTASSQPSSSSVSASAPAPQSAELTPDTIKQVQQTLQQQNLYRGSVDGVWGPRTEAAVREYQQQHNMDVTGKLDQQTMAGLNLVGSQQGNAQPPANAQPNQYSNYNPPPSNTPQQNANSNPPQPNTNTNTTR